MIAPRGNQPTDGESRAIAARQARQAVMAIAKAHTLFSGAANSLSPEHRAIADEAFVLLEEAVSDLREVVARLEGEVFSSQSRAREDQR